MCNWSRAGQHEVRVRTPELLRTPSSFSFYLSRRCCCRSSAPDRRCLLPAPLACLSPNPPCHIVSACSHRRRRHSPGLSGVPGGSRYCPVQPGSSGLMSQLASYPHHPLELDGLMFMSTSNSPARGGRKPIFSSRRCVGCSGSGGVGMSSGFVIESCFGS